MNRPNVDRVKRYVFFSATDQIPGIALMRNRKLVAHLTPKESVDFAHAILNILENNPELQQRAMPGPDMETQHA